MGETSYLAREDVIDEARDFVRVVSDAEAENRNAGEQDLLFKAGDQWPATVRTAREAGDNPRPCLTINEIPSFINQIVNDYRQNRPDVQVHPVGSNAQPRVAEVIAGLGRHIMYASGGDMACDVALESAVDIGFGYYRLYTDYVEEDSFLQEIRFGTLANTFSVYFDPHSVALTGADAHQVVITEMVPRKEFERKYPDAEASSMSLIGSAELGPEWITEDAIQLAEYYRCEYVDDTLLMTADGQTGWASAMPLAALGRIPIVQQRTVQRKVIKWYLCTGVDLLDEKIIPGKWIPVLPVYGSTVLIRGKKKRFGLIRLLRDPQSMLNYWETTKTELLALQPRAPWVGPAGFMDGFEQDWKAANQSNVVALEYNYVDDLRGSPMPAPQRMPFPQPPTGIIEASASAQQYMQVVTGVHQPVRLTPGSSRSGASIDKEDMQGDMASYHYYANAAQTLIHAWRIMIGWIPYYYDTPRVVRILGEDGQAKSAQINQPQGMDVDGIGIVLNDLTVGDYDVVLSTGPSYQTKRESAVAAMSDLAKGWPKLLDIAGSDMVRNMDWPGADQIADKLQATEPPAPLDGEEGPSQGQLRALLQQAHMQISQGQQQMQGLFGAAQKLSQENQELKMKQQDKMGELQVKMGELELQKQQLLLKQRELYLQEQDMLLRHQAQMAQIRAQHQGDLLAVQEAEVKAAHETLQAHIMSEGSQ